MRNLARLFAIGISLIAVNTLSARAGAGVSATEQRLIDACRAWWQPLDINAEATATPRAGGICISGFIDAGRDNAILSALGETAGGTSPLVMIQSGGGDFEASMKVAEALLARKTTVIVDKVCASACANYILAAGTRRIVLQDSLFLFHGGMTADLMAQAEVQVKTLVQQDPQIERGKALTMLKAEVDDRIARQNSFMVKAGIDPAIFEWMGRVNRMSEEEIAGHCPAGTTIIQYSRDSLQRFGYRFDLYAAPASQAEIDALLAKLGRPLKVCFWREPQ